MQKEAVYGSILKYFVLVFCVTWLVFFMMNNEVPADVGDGVMHFFYSQASWQNPDLFLHHWGKPFFILVSSPFAQFGFNGMVLFNILVFTGIILIAFRILNKLNVSNWLQLIFPLLLLVAHDVTNTIFGGLTEPLFNLAAMLAVCLLLEKRFLWFAIIVSFMPFMRSEGQLPVVLALVLLIYNKQFKTIPYLFLGFILYSIAGIFVYGDFWWYFTRSAYHMSNSIYGKGTWDHYLLSYKNYLGNPSLYILILGIPAMFVLAVKKRWNDLLLEWWFFAYGIFTGVIVLHSYFLATGQNGALGLTRIATQGMPIFVLLHLYYLSRFKFFNHLIAKLIFGVFAIIMTITLVGTKIYPLKADPMEKQIIETARYLKSLNLKKEKVFYHFPLLGFYYGENPFLKGNTLIFYSFGDIDKDLQRDFKPGDFIVRDSHFGPMEAGLHLKDLARHAEIVKVKEFISSEQIQDKHGEVEGLVVYQIIPIKKQQKVSSVKRELKSGQKIKIGANQEFTDFPNLPKKFEKDMKLNITFTSLRDCLHLVYDYNSTEVYSNIELKAGIPVSNSYFFSEKGETKLYIWNPKKVDGEIVIEKMEVEELNFHPVMRF